MKYIFDFDDVIFDSQKFKEERLFTQLIEFGISKDLVRNLYQKNFSSSRDLYVRSFETCGYDWDVSQLDILESNLFQNIDIFLNKDVVNFLRQAGKSNCIVLSAGDYEFQNKKIKDSGITDLVLEVVVVPWSKKEWILGYMHTYKDETVYFVDNTESHLAHPEFKNYKNLNLILYTNPRDLVGI